nr:hypothetical protein [Tanacetum cinerariifolium]
MIHDLSTNGSKTKNKLDEDMVKPIEKNMESREIDADTECCNDGVRTEEGMEEVSECLSKGKKDCEATGMDLNSSNVRDSGNVDTISLSTSSSDRLIDSQVNIVDNVENNSYVQALSKNLIKSDNKLFTVPTSVNEKGDDVVIFYEDLVNEGSEKWKFTHGLRDIVVDNDEICFAKFKDEE